MYHVLFYSILIVSTLLLIKSRVGKKWWRPRHFLGKAAKNGGLLLLGLIALTLWTLQVLQLTAPRGSLLHEAARLPEHYFHLNRLKTEGLQVQRYTYGEHHRQYLLLIHPSTPQVKGKIIFYVHGGGWHVGKPKSHLPLAKVFSDAGYTVVMPAYRLGPWHDYYDQSEDMHLALKRTLEIQNEQQWCEREIVLGGTSAGGNLAALLLYDRARLSQMGLSQRAFQGFFSLAGALDIAEMPATAVLQNYAGAPSSKRFAQANPVSYIRADEQVPVLCIHGDQDGLVSYHAACSFVDHLKRVDKNLVELHSIPGGTHLEVASEWYYKPAANYGQNQMLLTWLEKL